MNLKRRSSMGKNEKVEDATETSVTEDTTTEPQTPVLPASKEELDALIAVAAEKAKLEAQEEYRGIQRTVSKKDREIEELRKRVSQPPETTEDLSIYEAMIADRKGRAEYESNDPVIAQLEAKLNAAKQKQTRDNQARYQERVTRESWDKCSKLIEDAGLDLDDEKLDDFRDAFDDAKDTGRFERAERKLNRILGKVKPEAKGETEAERIERLAEAKSEEKLLAKMAKKGMVDTDNSEPSGVSTSTTKAMEEYVKGKITAEEAKKRGCVFN